MEIRIRAAGASDVGRVRRTNEDAFAFDLDRGLFLVCDGVGGASAGEVASRTAVDCMLASFPAEVPDPHAGGSELERSIQAASRSIYRAAQSEPLYAGMATTIVAAHYDGVRMWIAHVGDSRAYLLRRGSLHRLTEDHSQLQSMLREGQAGSATPDELARMDSILTQAIGASERVLPAVTMVRVEMGDSFLLATDGVTKSLRLPDMLSFMLASQSPEVACQQLTSAANYAGGEDNATCVVVAFD